MASFALWASQPTTVQGTATSTGFSMTTHLTEFLVNDSVENFKTKTNNGKYDRDGGVVGYTQTASLSTFDARGLAGTAHPLKPGTYLVNVKATYASEGPSANLSTYGTLTTTIAVMRCLSKSESDQNGRKLFQATYDIESADGTTAPITYAIS